jgi:DNA polymerase delta subunit 1
MCLLHTAATLLLQGLETVRRDNCMLVRKVVETCLHKILIERDVNGAIAHSKEVISQVSCSAHC